MSTNPGLIGQLWSAMLMGDLGRASCRLTVKYRTHNVCSQKHLIAVGVKSEDKQVRFGEESTVKGPNCLGGVEE